MGTSTFAERLSQIQEEVAEAALGSGRAPEDITLIGVSKRKPVEDMQQAYEAGLRDFGENRAQEVRDKFPGFNPPDIVRHFIGHLQSNKVKYLPGRVDIIHTIDSIRIADAIDERFGAQDLAIPVLVEINISGESNKEGVDPFKALELAAYCSEKSNLEFQGLMTIGPLTADSGRIRQAFREMKLIHEQVVRQLGSSGKAAILSMGMSSDFKIAIEEGATHIRVGTALFGAREY
ncbi:MAG: YggS family pyridoxal phosphate-dependent enzyme [Candidatus Marinimicrobia bacterium]|nr:YggS family pyridoxal phosphate-dependent enzyme [Candidatus Neomarinimicrobiota bacterium]